MMLGQLPTTLNVAGKTYKIRTDYRDILRIFSALNSKELSDQEKAYVLMKQIYIELENIPRSDYQSAYEAAFVFIECHIHEERSSPRVVNWEKDEQLIFPAINKVAGFEVRSAKYMHWWTFLGYFQGVDREDTWGFILTIRQKKAKHKQLEKYEREFYNANRALCMLDTPKDNAQRIENTLASIYEELLKGGPEDGGQ